MIAYFSGSYICLFLYQLWLHIFLSIVIAYFFVSSNFLFFVIRYCLFFYHLWLRKLKRSFVKTFLIHTSIFDTQIDDRYTHTVVISSEGKLRTESWYMIAIPGMWLKSAVAAYLLRTLNEILQVYYKVSRVFLLSLCNFASNTFHEKHLGINFMSRETV